MRWARRAICVATIGLGGLLSSPASATTPPDETTTTIAATTTTVPAGVVTGPTLPRGGSATGGLVHETGATDWDLRRIATMGGLTLAALAVAGFLFGRMQSLAPPAPAAAEPTSSS